MLAAFTILCCKTSSKISLVWYIIKAKNLFKTSIYALEVMLSNLYHKIFICRPYSLTALRPAVRPTSCRCMSKRNFLQSGDSFLMTNMLFWLTFVLSTIACSLIIHSMDCAIEFVAKNHQMPAGINHKNISKPKMNPHKCKYI